MSKQEILYITALILSFVLVITTTFSNDKFKKENQYLEEQLKTTETKLIEQEILNYELQEEIFDLEVDIDVYNTILSIREKEIADIKLLARIIYSEAGNQEYEGMIAVGNVVLNRVNSDLFPNTVKEVIYQANQFSSVNNDYFNSPINEICLKAAVESYYNKVVPSDVLFFKADYCDTEWNYKLHSVIGNHLFYSN